MDADLLIVGGGVLGTFHAFFAQQRGLKVVLLERHPRPNGATVRNFGQVVPSGMLPDWQELGRESLRTYLSIQSQYDISVRQLGSIYLASNEEELALIEELAQINRQQDYPSQIWSAKQCRKRFPQLRDDYCRGGLYFPEEVSVNPRQMIHRLHEFLKQQSDLQLHFESCVCQLSSNRQTVEATCTNGRTFQANQAIVCSGSEFALLYPERFAASEIEAVKLQMLRLSPQPEVSIPGNVLTGLSIRRYESFSQCPSWQEIKSREDKQSFWNRWGVHILFKQEVDGGIILGDSHEYASAKDSDKLSFDQHEEINRYFLSEASKIFDLPRWQIESSWSGFYCQTKHPSGIFQETVDERVHVVTAIGGKGMTGSAGFAKRHIKERFA